MPEPIKFDEVADLYDYYVNVDFDAGFFIDEARKSGGAVLELTSGTGRLSIPLLKAGIDLTCVDYSEKMLAVLKRKLADESLSCSVHEMDITELALDEKYDLIFIPFNSLSEILEPEKHEKALKSIREHLSENGKFICTMHNPEVRLRTVDGEMKKLGEYPMEDTGMLVMKYILRYDGNAGIVSGTQFYELYGGSKKLLSERSLDISFYLFGKEEFEKLAERCGFKITEIYGNYDSSPFDEKNSPYIIYKMEPSL